MTVPACESCNGGYQKDDEYFRTTLAFRDEADDVPEIRGLRHSVRSDLTRPQKERFVRSIQQTMHRVQLFGPDGRLVVDRPMFLLNETRIKTVVMRTVVGIHYRATGTYLGADWGRKCWSYRQIPDLDPRDAEVARLAVPALESVPPISLANGQFVYRYLAEPPGEDPGLIVCSTLFYQKVGYLTLLEWRAA